MEINLKSLFPLDETVVSTDVLMRLLKSMKDAHSTGIDYLKFKHSVEALKGINSDEATALKSAMISMSSFGLSKESLMESLQEYIAVLKKERKDFVLTVANQLDTQVNQKANEVEKLEERKLANRQSIEKLQKENELIDVKVAEIKLEQAAAKEKIENVASRFETTYQGLQNIILKDQEEYETVL